MPSDKPTLVDLLDEACWFLRDQGRPELIENLRAAAARLREEMERAERAIASGDDETANAGARRMNLLYRINGGGGPLGGGQAEPGPSTSLPALSWDKLSAWLIGQRNNATNTDGAANAFERTLVVMEKIRDATEGPPTPGRSDR